MGGGLSRGKLIHETEAISSMRPNNPQSHCSDFCFLILKDAKAASKVECVGAEDNIRMQFSLYVTIV